MHKCCKIDEMKALYSLKCLKVYEFKLAVLNYNSLREGKLNSYSLLTKIEKELKNFENQ